MDNNTSSSIVRQCGDGFKNRRTNFPGRAWTPGGVANLAKSGHNRGSTKLFTPSPLIARRRPHHGFLMGTLGRAQAKKCHTYSAHHSRQADILKDRDVKSENISWGNVRRGVRSDGKPLGRRSCPTGNLSRQIPQISSLSCGGLSGFRPTTGGSTQQHQQQCIISIKHTTK